MVCCSRSGAVFGSLLSLQYQPFCAGSWTKATAMHGGIQAGHFCQNKYFKGLGYGVASISLSRKSWWFFWNDWISNKQKFLQSWCWFAVGWNEFICWKKNTSVSRFWFYQKLAFQVCQKLERVVDSRRCPPSRLCTFHDAHQNQPKRNLAIWHQSRKRPRAF